MRSVVDIGSASVSRVEARQSKIVSLEVHVAVNFQDMWSSQSCVRLLGEANGAMVQYVQ